MINLAMEIAESGDKCPVDPVVTGDCRVWSWVPALLVVTGKSAGLSRDNWEQLPVVLAVKVNLPVSQSARCWQPSELGHFGQRVTHPLKRVSFFWFVQGTSPLVPLQYIISIIQCYVMYSMYLNPGIYRDDIKFPWGDIVV